MAVILATLEFFYEFFEMTGWLFVAKFIYEIFTFSKKSFSRVKKLWTGKNDRHKIVRYHFFIFRDIFPINCL